MIELKKLFLLQCCLKVFAKIPCDPESFKFVNSPSSINYNDTVLFQIQNYEEIGCAINSSYIWEIYRVTYGDTYNLTSRALKITGVTTSLFNLVSLSAYSFKEDMFIDKFVLRVTLIPRPTHFRSYRELVFTISKERHALEIEGPPKIYHTLGTGSLWLNAKIKGAAGTPFSVTEVTWRCHPVLKDSVASHTLSWEIHEIFLRPGFSHTCTVTARTPNGGVFTASKEIFILSDETESVLEVYCNNSNCILADPYKDSILSYKCYGKCSQAAWLVYPYDEALQKKLVYSKNDSNVIIPARTFDYGMSCTILGSLGQTTSNFTVTYLIPNVTLQLECIRNCFVRQKEIVIKVNCFGLCENISYYSWEIVPLPMSWSWKHVIKKCKCENYTFAPYIFPQETGANVTVFFMGNNATMTFMTTTSKPIFQIECKSTGKECNYYSPPEEILELKATCLQDCDIIGYVWNLIPMIPNHHWQEFASLDNTVLTFPPYTFKRNTTLTATFFTIEFLKIAEIIVNFTEPPELEIRCIQNCINGTGNSFHPVILEVICHTRCIANYSWQLSDAPDSEDVLSQIKDNTRLFIPGNMFHPNESTTVSVKAAEGVAYFNLRFMVPDVQFKIFCIQNCLYDANPALDLILRVVCFSNCEDVRFQWEISPIPDDFKWHDYAAVDFQNVTFTLRQKFFSSDELKIFIKVTAAPYRKEEIYSLVVNRPTPEIVIECKSNCVHFWIHFPVQFLVRCLKNCVHGLYTWEVSNYEHIYTTEHIIALDDELTLRPHRFVEGVYITIKVSYGPVENFTHFTYQKMNPILRLTCEPKPCTEVQNLFEKVSIVVSCLKDCYDFDFSWSFLPPLPPGKLRTHVLFGYLSTSITFRPQTFSGGSHVNVTASIANANVSTDIIFGNPIPEFYIQCYYNCKFSDPYDKVILKIICDWLCQYIDFYFWDFPIPENTTSEKFWLNIRISPKGDHVVIAPFVYKDGDIIHITATGTTVTSKLTLSFVEPKPKLKIFCQRNCEYNPAKQTVLGVICTDACLSPWPYIWTLNPSVSNLQCLNSNKSLLIPSSVYGHSENVTATVCKGEGCVSEKLSYWIPFAYFEIICIENCKHNLTANPILKTVLRVLCQVDCEEHFLKLNWHIDPVPISRNDSRINFSFDSKNVTLTISPNTYINNTCITVSVSAQVWVKSAEICFHQPMPDFVIICAENCGYPEPDFDLIVQIKCLKNCYGVNYIWTISPLPRHAVWEEQIIIHTNKLSAKILGNTYRDKENIVFTVRCCDIEKKKQFLYASRPPVFKLICLPHCEKILPKTTLVIRTFCTLYCSDPKYTWKVIYQDVEFDWGFNIVLDPKNESLTINSGTFFNGSSLVVSAQTDKWSEAHAIVNYYIPPLELNVTCLENCIFKYDQPIRFSISCKSSTDCSMLPDEARCDFVPKPVHPIIVSASEGVLKIKILEYSYRPEDNVVFTCTYANKTSKQLMQFEFYKWNGNCSIFPNIGVSGMTEHKIECNNFSKTANFMVYQNLYESQTNFKMLLIISKRTFMNNVYLGPSHEITIDICDGWTVMASITIEVKNSFFSLSEEVQTRLSSQETDKNLEHEYFLRNKFKEFELLLHIAKYEKAMQLAFVLINSPPSLCQSLCLGIKYNILQRILYHVNKIKPEQILTYLMIGYENSSEIDLKIIEITMEIVYMVAQRFNYYNDPDIPYNTKKLQEIGFFLYKLTNTSWYRIFQLNITIFEKEQGVFYPAKMKKPLFADKIMLHIAYRAVNVVDLISELVKKIKETTVFSEDSLILKSVSLPTSKENIPHFTIHETIKSFVQFNRELFIGNVEKFITVTCAAFRPSLLWFTEKLYTPGAEEIYFSLSDDKKIKLEKSFIVFLYTYTSKQYRNVSLNVRTFFVMALSVPINYTLELTAFGNDVKISISFAKPTRNYTSDFGLTLKKNKTIMYFAEFSPIYLGFFGLGMVNLSFTALACLTWNGLTTDYRIDTCRPTVFSEQVSNEFIVCKCFKAAVITADTIMPEIIMIKAEKGFKGTLPQESKNWIYFVLSALFLSIAIMHVNNARRGYTLVVGFVQDNDFKNKEVYLIAIQTGLLKHAGTTARISVVLIGRNGVSDVHVLNPEEFTIFQRNSTNVFYILTPAPLGEIRYLQMWHDLHGSKPDWFCDTVIVKDLSAKKSYVFFVSRWFSAARSPFTVFGTFSSKKKYRKIPFNLKLKTALRSNHYYLGLLAYLEKDESLWANLMISVVSILVIMTTCDLLLRTRNVSKLYPYKIYFVAAFIGELVVVLFDLIFRNTA